MRILHVIGSMDPKTGGPCQGIRNSIPELEKLDVYREIVTVDDPNNSYLGEDSFPIHALGPSKTAWQYSSKLLPWFRANIERFDVIILNGLWLYQGFALLKSLKELHHRIDTGEKKDRHAPKFFVMPHGMLDPYFQRAGHRKLKALRNLLYWKIVENRVVEKASGVLFTCQTELELARLPFRPYHPKKELNVGYGIGNPPTYIPNMRDAFLRKCPSLARRRYLLFISRIHDKKGVDLLIEAYLAIVRDRGSSSVPTLVIAGPGEDTDFGKKMKALAFATEAGKQNISFAGMLSGDAKWGAFYGCEAFILPSHQENFGIAVAEALACGKPVLISNKVNICKEIEVCECGFVEDDTLSGTTQIINKWIDLDFDTRQRMGDNARECYQTNFSIRQAAKNFLAAIVSTK